MTCKTSRPQQDLRTGSQDRTTDKPVPGRPTRHGTALLPGNDAALGAILVVSASLRRRLEE